MSTPRERIERGARFYQRLRGAEGCNAATGCGDEDCWCREPKPVLTTYDPWERELERLTSFLAAEYPNHPVSGEEGESAVDVATRLLSHEDDQLEELLTAFDDAGRTWGAVPDEDVEAQYALWDASSELVNYIRSGGTVRVATDSSSRLVEERDQHTLEFVLKEAGQVYDHVTGGKVTSANTRAEGVITAADDRTAELVLAGKEYYAQLMDQMATREEKYIKQIDELREDLETLRDEFEVSEDVRTAEAQLHPDNGWSEIPPPDWLDACYSRHMQHLYREGERIGWVNASAADEEVEAGVRVDSEYWVTLGSCYPDFVSAKAAVVDVLSYFEGSIGED